MNVDVWGFYQPIYGDLFSLNSIPCYHCNNVVYRAQGIVVQVIPSSLDGSYTLSNLRISCFNCAHECIGLPARSYASEQGYKSSIAVEENLHTMKDCEDLYRVHRNNSSCVLL